MARLTLLALCGAALLARHTLNFVAGRAPGRAPQVSRRAEADEAGVAKTLLIRRAVMLQAVGRNASVMLVALLQCVGHWRRCCDSGLSLEKRCTDEWGA